MIEEAGAYDVYFEDNIEVLVADADEFDVDQLRDALDQFEFEYSSIVERR